MIKKPERLERVCPTCVLEAADSYKILYPMPHEVLECQQCGLVFINEALTKTEAGEFGIKNFQRNAKPRIAKSRHDFENLRRFIAAPPRGKPPIRVLDIGCGLGHFLIEAFRHGWKTYGTEINKNAVESLEKHPQLNVQIGNIEEQMNFPAECFDVITMFGVIEHLVNPTDAVQECYRLLKPGGVLCLQTPTEDGFLRKAGHGLYKLSGGKIRFHVGQFYFLNGGHNLCFSRHSIGTLLGKNGFEIVEIFGSTFGLKNILLRFRLRPKDIIKIIGTSTVFALGKVLNMPNHMTVYARRH
jgi:2-polyprenyl-3-methyl-5-hydroxy-6-metoxy-1,4-benzoquinol methylase